MMTVQQVGNTSNSAQLFIKIRRPPIVLVHGFNSNSSAWYLPSGLVPNAFLSALQAVFPADFAFPVQYGVDPSHPNPNYANTYDSFEALAPLLDEKLRLNIEGSTTLRSKWAFTRYDVVGHSQGGILLRMLCTRDNPSPGGGSFLPFRSANNAYRGRFHRVITIGSPHNGSTQVRFLLNQANQGILIPRILRDRGILQDKFDPFGAQMQEINVDHWHVDPGAKVHAIGTTIYNGAEPPLLGLQPPPPTPIPLSYFLMGLCSQAPGQSYSRGHIVLPNGSDGVVDRASELAGLGGLTHSTAISGNISHSGPAASLLFAVNSDADTDTASGVVAAKVIELLTDAVSSFGSFVLEPLPPGLKAQIDAVAQVRSQDHLIAPDASVMSRVPGSGVPNAASTYNFALNPIAGQEPASAPAWYAEVYGPAGVTSNGILVAPDTNNPNNVTVSVDSGVAGDVVLYVSYGTADGKLIVGSPITVVSRPPGASMIGIELMPTSILLSSGAIVQIDVWGHYDNGTESQLYITPEATITYASSNPNIAEVDGLGRVSLKAAGNAMITVSHLGFLAQTTVTVATLPAPPALVSPPADVPSITQQPSGASVYVGASISLSVTASGVAPLSYQWRYNGASIAGATSPTLSLNNLTQAQGGNYSAVVSNSLGAVVSSPALLDVLQPVQFGNISTRLRVQSADNVLIGGFIITGTRPKRVSVRAIGPSLTSLGVAGALADPLLELYDASGQIITTNDNWVESANRNAIFDSGLAPANDHESAILTTVNPGLYTAIVRGVNDGTGIGVVEAYDLDRTIDSKLANISTRGFVNTGDNVMIGGTIILGNTSATVLIRAIGPSLTSFGVPNALQDPTLELRDSDGALLASNDNWRSDQETEIMATGIPPTNNFESAILWSLPPGAYTAIVRGSDNSTGVALVEAYQLQ